MMPQVARIIEDGRPIIGLTNEAQGVNFAWVGQRGVTRIVAYEEPGQCAHVPWFAVYKGASIAIRISAEHVAIHYAPEPADG